MVNLKQIKSTLENLGVETEKVDAAISALEEQLSALNVISVNGRDIIDQMLGCMMGIEQILGIDEQNQNHGRRFNR